MALRIGLSHAPERGQYPNYHRAVRAAAARVGVEVETIDLSQRPELAGELDGLVLTGGPDIDPGAYGMPEYALLCDVDEARDAAERKILEAAEARSVPIFAICRGSQLVNVVRGGTLVPDLPDVKAVHHGQIGGNDRRHPLQAEAGSSLAALAGASNGEVNSSHHQAVDRLAADFTVAARADDGTVEAFEWARPDGRPFLLAVQWHPERMEAQEPFSGPLFDRFVTEARAYSEVKS